MAEKDIATITPLDDTTTTTTTTNLKRKLEDLDESPSAADVAAPDSSDAIAADNDNVDDDPSKRPRLDDNVIENGHKPEGENGHAKEKAGLGADVENAETAVDAQADADEGAKEVVTVEQNEAQPVSEVELKDDAQIDNSKEIDAQNMTSGEVQPENVEKTSEEETHKPDSEVAAGDSGSKSISRKIEIPNNKVGVLIGKSGETIRFLQINSGAKIQITRDADADPLATTRTVEIVGSSENLNKAEMLIKDVIAEADAGGSPALVARGFTAALTAGATEVEIPVPGDKVGLIIGRGGETIKNLQTRSGARIQLIPQNVPGEQPKEKKVKITGDKKQVEVARELIKEVMNQLPGRPSQFSGSNYSQQSYPPRGPGGGPQWGNRGPPSQPMPYDYHQRGPYPSQTHQHPSQSYGNHPYQGPPRSNFSPGWDHRPPTQGPPHSGGYDYYGQGGGPRSAPMSMAPPPHSQGNYNYGQPRGADYPHPATYSQTTPPAQNYGQGYNDPKYGGQAPIQQPPYGGQGYAPPQQGYAPQQQYNRPPPYGMPSQGVPQGGYAPPTASQPSDTSYQAPVSGPGPTAQQPHQQYPYAPGPTAQPPYGSAPVTNDPYSQPGPQVQPGPAYGQPGTQAQPVPTYGQPGAQSQPIPAYGQPGAQVQPVPAYGQPGAQAQPVPAYGQQAAPGGYGYPGQADSSAYGYQGQADPSAYAPAAQTGYVQQPVAAQPGYDQSAPQAAPVPQPQPGYPQYDASQQMYAAPR